MNFCSIKYLFYFKSKADLCLCLGTSLQIRPCRDLPRKTKKNKGKLVIVNLQKTTMDSLADLIIHERCDRVMKYIMEKLNLNIEEKKQEELKLNNLSKYSHVKKVILLFGKSKTGKDFIGNKLAENLPALFLHLNQYAKTPGEDSTIGCRIMIEQNDQLCLSHSIWIINDVKSNEEIEFFKKYFNDCVLLVRIEASNDTRQKHGWSFQDDSQCQLDTNIQWSFVFSNNEEDNFDEQMNHLIKIIHS